MFQAGLSEILGPCANLKAASFFHSEFLKQSRIQFLCQTECGRLAKITARAGKTGVFIANAPQIFRRDRGSG